MKKQINIVVSGESDDATVLAHQISNILSTAGFRSRCSDSSDIGPATACIKFAKLICDNDIFVVVKSEQIKPEIKEKPAIDIDSPLYKTILTIINDILRIDTSDVKPESEFIKDLGADSLDTVELVMMTEEEFGIEMSDDETEKLITVADVYFYLKEHTCR